MPDTLPLTVLEAENILRLKAVTIHIPLDGAIIIEGKNEAGKSSVLRLADLLLSGARKGEDPIHGMEEEGHVTGKLGPYTATRRFKRGGDPVLTIREEGKRAKLKAPQTLFKEFVGYIGVDAMKFVRMPPEEQLAVISRLVEFDPTAYDAKRKNAFAERTLVNRDVKKLEGVLSGLTHHSDAPAEEVTVSELAAELVKRREHNQIGHEKQQALATARGAVKAKESEITTLQREIERLTKELMDTIDQRDKAESVKTAREADAKRCLSEVAAFEPADEAEVVTQMENAETINRKVRENAKRKRTVEEHEALTKTSESLTSTIDEIDAEKAAARKKAAEKLAIPGLDITDTGIIYNGKPFAQAGMSASIRISAAIAMASAEDKPVKLLTIDEAQALDEDNLPAVIKDANDAGFQVMMARNGKGEEPGTITIEDGRIAD
jgi:hypothetical protein